MHGVALTALVAALFPAFRSGTVRSATATIDGRTVTYVAPLDRVRVRVALGQDRPGRTESLSHMAARYQLPPRTGQTAQ